MSERKATKVAAISWQASDGEHIRVYFQREDNFIYEAAYDPSTKWSEPTKIFQAKPGTPLSAVALTPSPPDILLFGRDARGLFTEYAYYSDTRSWEHVQSNDLLNLSNDGDFVVIGYETDTGNGWGWELRVFYESIRQEILEATRLAVPGMWDWNFDPIGQALRGTGIAATVVNDVKGGRQWKPTIFVHYQHDELLVGNMWQNGKWERIANGPPLRGPRSMSAASWKAPDDTLHMRIYIPNEDGIIAEFIYDPGTGWIFPPHKQPGADSNATPGAGIAAVHWESKGPVIQDHIRVFFQGGGDKMHDWEYDGQKWKVNKLAF